MPFSPHTSTLFKVCNILKLVVIVNLECWIFVNHCFSKDSISIFTKCFKLASSTHCYNSRSVINGLLFLLSYNCQICVWLVWLVYICIFIFTIEFVLVVIIIIFIIIIIIVIIIFILVFTMFFFQKMKS